jgi:excisionase family DNA binding protein
MPDNSPSEVIDLAPPRGYVTTAVLAHVFNVHPRKIQRLTVNGELPIHAIQLGREYRYPLAELNRYLTEHGGEPLTDADIAAITAKAS